MENKEKVISVEIEISDKVLKSNSILNNYYDSKTRKLTYDLDENISDEVVEVLQEFISSDVVGSNQVALFNPLISALNELQGLKYLTYEPELTPEKEDEIKKKAHLEHLSFDVESKEYLFDFNEKALAKIGDDLDKFHELSEKTKVIIQKAIKEQHEASYQDFKDANKIIGSFNSSITNAKKELKAPYIKTNKMIDNLYNSLKIESENARNAIQENFQSALKIEQEKKDAAEAKKKQAELDKIAELSEQNKAINEKLTAQQTETNRLQAYNSIMYTEIGAYSSKIASAVQNFDTKALEILLVEVKAKSYEDTIKEVPNTELLNEFQVDELEDHFIVQKKYWQDIIEREISNKAIALENIQKNAEIQGMQRQMPSFPAGDSPFQVPQQPLMAGMEKEPLTDEHQIFEDFVNKLKEINDGVKEVFDEFSKRTFEDGAYSQIQTILTRDSFPQILSWNEKLLDWTNKKYESYKDFRNQ